MAALVLLIPHTNSQSLACLGCCAIHECEQLGHHASLMLPACVPAGAHCINLVQEDDHGLAPTCLCLCCLKSLPQPPLRLACKVGTAMMKNRLLLQSERAACSHPEQAAGARETYSAEGYIWSFRRFS